MTCTIRSVESGEYRLTNLKQKGQERLLTFTKVPKKRLRGALKGGRTTRFFSSALMSLRYHHDSPDFVQSNIL